MSAKLIIGDDFKKKATLTDSDTGLAWDVSAGTLKATVLSKDYKVQYFDEVTLSAAETGADWVNGIVIINLPAATTANIDNYVSGKTYGVVSLQVEISGIKTTVHDSIIIIQGHIA